MYYDLTRVITLTYKAPNKSTDLLHSNQTNIQICDSQTSSQISSVGKAPERDSGGPDFNPGLVRQYLSHPVNIW